MQSRSIGKSRGGDGASTQRIAIDGGERRAQPRDVSPEEFDGRKQVVGQRRRLRRLRVRIGRHDGFDVRGSQIEQHLASRRCVLRDSQHFVPQAHPVLGQVNIVAAARGVHFAGNFRAAFLHQQTLYVEEKVFAPAVIARRQDRVAV